MANHRFCSFVFAFALVTSAYAQSSAQAPVPIRTPQPVYPTELRRDGIAGVVVMKFTVDEQGNVVNPTVEKSSHTAFEKPALDAIVKWKFKPATQDGNAVQKTVSIPLKFMVQS